MGALSTVPCGRRNESCDGHILDVDERGGEWVEETVVCEEGMRQMSIDQSAETLLQLLNISINGRVRAVGDKVDWQNVMKLAQKQGVRGLAYEALELLKSGDVGCGSFPDRMTLMQWYAQTAFLEKNIAIYVALAKDVEALWREHGIQTIVFKGLAHSRYYPKPAHREFGDFDCYLIDGQGQCAYRQGNRIAREKGWAVGDGWYKHSHIAYKQLTIENHQFFTSARRGGTDMALHRFMVEAIGDGSQLEKLEGTEIYVLPIEAEGLFMLYHSLTHFLVEGINLRHFVDWACWIKVNQDRIRWSDFYADCKRFRLDGFVDVLNTIAVKYLGVELHDQTIFADSAYAERTLESALYDDSSIYNRDKGRWYERFHVIGNAFKYSWKYRDVAHYSMMGYVWRFVYGFLRRGEED